MHFISPHAKRYQLSVHFDIDVRYSYFQEWAIIIVRKVSRMKVLFIHQNFPGQYLNLAQYLLSQGDAVTGLGEVDNIKRRGTITGTSTVGYPAPQGAGQETHHYLRSTEAAIRRGQVVARALLNMRKSGFSPDVIYVHPGWGEGLFVKSVFPHVPLVMFCEFYFTAGKADVGFDPEFPVGLDQHFAIPIRNAPQELSLPRADALICPSRWQASRYPHCFRQDIQILHEGVNTSFMTPNTDDSITLERLPEPGHSRIVTGAVPDEGGPFITLSRKDKVISFVARNLEPYRGYHAFMRALPELQSRNPDVHVLIAGGDGVSYSPVPSGGKSYKSIYLDEVRSSIDFSRIHFVGHIPYVALRSIFRITSAHIYLTYPFVLSWSLLEALSCGSLLVASDTEPVREAITHGKNGLLVDFFDQGALVQTITDALANPRKYDHLRHAAREGVLADYELRQCLSRQVALLRQIAEQK